MYRLNPETKKLEQQPEMKEPERKGLNLSGALSFEVAMNKYKEHIASLPSYDISGSIPESWLSGRDIPESEFKVEYEHGGYCKNDGTKPNLVAYPIIKQEQPSKPSL